MIKIFLEEASPHPTHPTESFNCVEDLDVVSANFHPVSNFMN